MSCCKVTQTHIYLPINRTSLDNCVSDYLKAEYFRAGLRWLPAEACPEHTEHYIQKEPLEKHGRKNNAAKTIIELQKERYD